MFSDLNKRVLSQAAEPSYFRKGIQPIHGIPLYMTCSAFRHSSEGHNRQILLANH